MSQVLFVNVFGDGHINPTLSMVGELIERGEKISYIAGEEFKEKIEGTGAEFIGYTNFDELGFLNGNINLGEMEPQFLKIAAVYKEIVDIIFSLNSKVKFDYIIYDSLFFLGNEVARVLDIPAISSTTTFASNDKTDYFSIFINACRPAIEKLSDRPEFMETLSYLWAEYNIKVNNLFKLHTIKNELNIVYTSKYFQILGDSFDESYKFIGPPIIDRSESIDFSLEKNDDQKIIYISLGTIFNSSIDFYESCFKAFGHMEAKIIMSVGKNIAIDTLNEIPDNFIVRNHVPQLEVLKHADVFITHGGMNSTNEGLYYCVPLILVPHFFDQHVVANRVVELGAGIALDRNTITPELLKQSVDRILSDSNYTESSKIISNSLKEAGGYMKGCDDVFSLKNKKSRPVEPESVGSTEKIPAMGRLIYS